MRTPQDILENMEEEINRLKKELAKYTNDPGYALTIREENIELEKEISSLKELIVQATPYVEYAVKYSTPLSQKLSEEWLEKTQARREK